MNDIEIRRLAHALNELRPDWPVSSLTTWLTRNMTSRPYRDAAVALVWVAVDTKPDGTPATERPARVLEPGPWWNAAAINGTANAGHPHPPKRGEDCPRHPGQWADNCGGCRADALAATYDDEPPATPEPRPRPASPDTKTAALAAMRAGLRGKEEADE